MSSKGPKAARYKAQKGHHGIVHGKTSSDSTADEEPSSPTAAGDAAAAPHSPALAAASTDTSTPASPNTNGINGSTNSVNNNATTQMTAKQRMALRHVPTLENPVYIDKTQKLAAATTANVELGGSVPDKVDGFESIANGTFARRSRAGINGVEEEGEGEGVIDATSGTARVASTSYGAKGENADVNTARKTGVAALTSYLVDSASSVWGAASGAFSSYGPGSLFSSSMTKKDASKSTLIGGVGEKNATGSAGYFNGKSGAGAPGSSSSGSNGTNGTNEVPLEGGVVNKVLLGVALVGVASLTTAVFAADVGTTAVKTTANVTTQAVKQTATATTTAVRQTASATSAAVQKTATATTAAVRQTATAAIEVGKSVVNKVLRRKVESA